MYYSASLHLDSMTRPSAAVSPNVLPLRTARVPVYINRAFVIVTLFFVYLKGLGTLRSRSENAFNSETIRKMPHPRMLSLLCRSEWQCLFLKDQRTPFIKGGVEDAAVATGRRFLSCKLHLWSSIRLL
ncbi:hypothetical protein FKM82_023058 [Ascaphus truei]